MLAQSVCVIACHFFLNYTRSPLAREKSPVVSMSSLRWKLTLVLKILIRDFYDTLEHSSLRALSFKTALLLVLTSVKTMCKLIAQSVNPCFFYFG